MTPSKEPVLREAGSMVTVSRPRVIFQPSIFGSGRAKARLARVRTVRARKSLREGFIVRDSMSVHKRPSRAMDFSRVREMHPDAVGTKLGRQGFSGSPLGCFSFFGPSHYRYAESWRTLWRRHKFMMASF